MIPGIYDIYEGSIWRPPSEAYSLILQATVGCSHNMCTFCGTYRDKTFRTKTTEQLKRDVDVVYPHAKNVKKIFLADGNALVIGTEELVSMLEMLRSRFGKLERIGVYGSPSDINKKSLDELKQLKKAGLGIIYLGLESGSDKILKKVRKGALSKHMISGARKVKDAGILFSVIFIIGLGGKEHTMEHGKETGRVLSEMDPDYIGGLTLMLVEGTEIDEEVKLGKMTLLDPKETLQELLLLVKELELSNCMVRINHASNYVPIGGTFPQDKEKVVHQLEGLLASNDINFKPEYMRGL